MIWHGLSCEKKKKASKDVPNLWVKHFNYHANSEHHEWMTINLKKKKKVEDWFGVCSQRVTRYFWSVNKFVRAVIISAKNCDKRLARFISYIPHTSVHQQYCYVGNTATQCRLGLFQDSDFAGDLEDSKSTSCGTMRVFGSHTFVPIS